METTVETRDPITDDVDAVVIGAGFAGLYMNQRLRDQMGLQVQVFETGDGVGGTWYWNRYPGARCDSESYIYCYSFDKDLMQEWEWSGKYPEQPEILRYLNHVADRHDLRRNVAFETRVTSAHWDEDGAAAGRSRPIAATASAPSSSSPPSGASRPARCRRSPGWSRSRASGTTPVRGRTTASTSAGKRVGVIGTGSSGVQSIPRIAEQAGHLTVFQRTAQYTVPARHGTVDKAFLDDDQDPVRRHLRAVPRLGRWAALHADGPLGAGRERRGARRHLRSGVAGGRVQVPARHVQRHLPRPSRQRHRVGVHPQQDPRDHQGPRWSPRSWCPSTTRSRPSGR